MTTLPLVQNGYGGVLLQGFNKLKSAALDVDETNAYVLPEIIQNGSFFQNLGY